jgi:hypothetical protein
MRNGHLIFSFLHLIVVFLVISLGLFVIAAAYFDHIRIFLADLLLNMNKPYITLLGLMILGGGLLMFLAFYVMYRQCYYQVLMSGTKKASIDLHLIEQIVKRFWGDKFALDECILDIVMHPNQTLEIIAEIPSMAFKEEKKMLREVEKELGELLKETLAYEKEFLMTVVKK